jgi:hypothetical protein
MYDTGTEAWALLSRLFPNLTDTDRAMIYDLMSMGTSTEDRSAIRALLARKIGVDPLFEIGWARATAERWNLDDPSVREENRRLFYNGWFAKDVDTDDRVAARDEFINRLGRDPYEDDAPLRDWDS